MEIKHALITGGSSGIGLATVNTLLELGCSKIWSLARHEHQHRNGNVIPIICDVSDMKELQHFFTTHKNAFKDVNIVIANAGVGYFGPHETISLQHIQEMVATNVFAPMGLAKLFLPVLRENQGTFISISSVAAGKINTHGCAYGATKSAMTSFSKSLFEEVRKSSVQVITIAPDMTDTEFYNHADFKPASESQYQLSASLVAQTIKYCLQQPDGAVVTELTIRPQKNKIERK